MARFRVLWLMILTYAFVILSMASNVASSEGGVAEMPAARKVGKHHRGVVSVVAAPCLSPSESPQGEENYYSSKQGSSSLESETGQAQDIHHRHHSIDESSAGGGLILGGLATTFLVAIICYIRATRRKSAVAASANIAEPADQV